MNLASRTLSAAIVRRTPRQGHLRSSTSFILVAAVSFIAAAGYLLHLNLSAISSIYLLFVVFTSLRLGFLQATVASVASVLCMNYLFIPPLFRLQIADSQNWISLATFETAALFVSRLSSRVVEQAQLADVQRDRTAKLYELSRAILLIDSRTSHAEQLAALVREIVQVQAVHFWVVYNAHPASATSHNSTDDPSPEAVFLSGMESDHEGTTTRILRLGTTSIGAMVLRGWSHDALLADAVASLAAIAFERVRAIQQENRAEAERNTEQLRTAVLDGLAHGFKTPLTAIQTASSGLLAIDRMTPVQAELVSIIDEQATMLSHMTTHLLQTAALESKDVRLRRSTTSILPFVQDVVAVQQKAIQSRLRVSATTRLEPIDMDSSLVELALVQLIDNACKYSALGHPIDLLLSQDERETTIIVSNHGSPIPAHERTAIFERFYRGHDAPHGPSGTGLGLSVVKKIAEAHGGRSWVECEDGITRFCFTIENYRPVSHG